MFSNRARGAAGYKEEQVAVLQQCMQDDPLCALVTQTAQGMVAIHLPMVFSEHASANGL